VFADPALLTRRNPPFRPGDQQNISQQLAVLSLSAGFSSLFRLPAGYYTNGQTVAS
jgi:hypothetical protein